ncbi:MAG: hypothetical protein JOZ40_05230, partial [Methylobacteriaceae bacterium]|nr:hypothetical protein [Methylobacteriaceae bacterium]
MKAMRAVVGIFATDRNTEGEVRSQARWRRTATIAMLAAIAAAIVVGGITTPNFLTFNNLLVVIRNA